MVAPGLLHVDRVSAGYGRLDVLHDVSLSVMAGEVVAIIGPNGAGKSTVLKAVMGLVHVSDGTVSFDGRVITGGRPNHRVDWGHTRQMRPDSRTARAPAISRGSWCRN